jgi:hydroxymethylpyrimidine/phosphomethylpyrimidine kinase
VLVVGGLEAAGRVGVGLLADAEAVEARRGEPVLAASVVTAQGPSTFLSAPVATKVLIAQIRVARERGPIHAVKLGVVPGPVQLAAVRRALAGLHVPWVVDPVVRSSTGGQLSRLSPRSYLSLARRNVWITPNAEEAGWLLRRPPVQNVAEAKDAARALLDLGFAGVVVKGGHLVDATGVDVLATPRITLSFRSRPLARGPGHRGTGCRLASAMATELGRGRSPAAALKVARIVVRGYLARR